MKEFSSHEEFISFLQNSKKKIVIYGAGGQGQRLYKYLNQHDIHPIGFCVTSLEGNLKKENVLTYCQTVSGYSDLFILIGTTEKYAKEIENTIKMMTPNAEYTFVRMPFKIDNVFLKTDWLDKNQNKLLQLKKMFSDQASVNIINDLIIYKQTGNAMPLYSKIDGVTFFDDSVLKRNPNYCYVDCGAYTGDTIMKFCQYAGTDYQSIIGIEMERGNFKCLSEFIDFSKLERVTLMNRGLWSHNCQGKYYTTSDFNFFNANLYYPPDDVSCLEEKNHMDEIGTPTLEVSAELIALDNLLSNTIQENELSNLIIKINAMGADLEILKGAASLIQKYKPVFILEYGVKPEHIIEIPFLLKRLNPSYQIYLRQKLIFGSSKTILYAL